MRKGLYPNIRPKKIPAYLYSEKKRPMEKLWHVLYSSGIMATLEAPH